VTDGRLQDLRGQLEGVLGLLLLARFRVESSSFDELLLPWYERRTFREAFGPTLQTVVCAFPLTGCEGCGLAEVCAYPRTFNPSRVGNRRLRGRLNEVPHPFVLGPPPAPFSYLRAGERATFDLTLVGEAAGWLPYFVLALEDLVRFGLGRRVNGGGVGRLALTGVQALHPTGEYEPVYDQVSGAVRAGGWARPAAEWWQTLSDGPSGHRLTVHFRTITRLGPQPDPREGPRFVTLFGCLLRRLVALAHRYAGMDISGLDLQALHGLAAGVRVVRAATRHVNWSTRPEEAATGLVGEVTYEACPETWQTLWPALALGSILHVGEDAAFGLGRYTITTDVS